MSRGGKASCSEMIDNLDLDVWSTVLNLKYIAFSLQQLPLETHKIYCCMEITTMER